MNRAALAAALMIVFAVPVRAAAPGTVNIVAAENFYGDIARQIAGPGAHIVSILRNPSQDPHMFEASFSAARAVSDAAIVLYNGIGYDPWMNRLMAAARSSHRTAIAVGRLAGRNDGDNPHVWYDPRAGLAAAKALAAALSTDDPAHRADYARNLARFSHSLQPVFAEITRIRARHRNLPVTATEPVFGPMFRALGMTVRNEPFQLAVMNGTTPSPSAVAAFEKDLRMHRVALMVYGSQTVSPLTDRMKALARTARIPVIGVSEMLPPGKTYQQWLLDTLRRIGAALDAGAP